MSKNQPTSRELRYARLMMRKEKNCAYRAKTLKLEAVANALIISGIGCLFLFPAIGDYVIATGFVGAAQGIARNMIYIRELRAITDEHNNISRGSES